MTKKNRHKPNSYISKIILNINLILDIFFIYAQKYIKLLYFCIRIWYYISTRNIWSFPTIYFSNIIYGGIYMNPKIITCPLCGAKMIKRRGPKIEFYGCSNYFATGCIGKRSLQWEAWGYSSEESFYLTLKVRPCSQHAFMMNSVMMKLLNANN